eukprot:m.121080 g.121080  ORF g.121080 m.121080 type:complete len:393 (-) comp16193_c0_seq1:1053-2231(-)
MATLRSDISQSKEYKSFRSTISRKRVTMHHHDDEIVWKFYDHGPRDVKCPLIFLPPVSGTADAFYKQIMALTALGYRCVAIDYPMVWSHEDFCHCFLRLLDMLSIDQAHLFGASLGGFLAQKFVEYTHNTQRVKSLTLCNSFTDTSIFHSTTPMFALRLMPGFMLKRMIMAGFPDGNMEAEIANSVDFMLEQLDGLDRDELASRLTLCTLESYVLPEKITSQAISIMLMESLDQTALAPGVREELQKYYIVAESNILRSEGRLAQLKTGGQFPFLSRDEEVNMFIRVLLQPFRGTRYSACADGASTNGAGSASASAGHSAPSSPTIARAPSSSSSATSPAAAAAASANSAPAPTPAPAAAAAAAAAPSPARNILKPSDKPLIEEDDEYDETL